MSKLRVTVWNEYVHEQKFEAVAKLYPKGIHGAIGSYLQEQGIADVTCVTMDMPENGLPQELLDNTDVLVWWGHIAHHKVADEVVERVFQRIQAGMGLILLHSAHGSKIFARLMGTNTPNLKWREAGEKEILWVVEPGHPIAEGIDEKIVLEHEETYGERFDIPAPDELVFISWFSGGEVFRSGCCYRRGKGRIFYFQPGHETVPTYYNPQILKVIGNAVRWAAPVQGPQCVQGNVPPVVQTAQAEEHPKTIGDMYHGD